MATAPACALGEGNGPRLITIHADVLRRGPGLMRRWADAVDVVVTSPPYKVRDGYSDDLMVELGGLVEKALKPSGMFFLNVGQMSERFPRPFDARRLIEDYTGLIPGQTIVWVKSIVVDDVQRGHFQPINSPHILNYCWEPIFTFHKPPRRTLDRLSVGASYTDKRNLARGTRGKNGDVHCAGDAWFIPYKTTGVQAKKRHRHEFPEALVERCLKLACVGPGDVVLDPFGGSGTSAVVAKRLGASTVIVDKDLDALEGAQRRWAEDVD